MRVLNAEASCSSRRRAEVPAGHLRDPSQRCSSSQPSGLLQALRQLHGKCCVPQCPHSPQLHAEKPLKYVPLNKFFSGCHPLNGRAHETLTLVSWISHYVSGCSVLPFIAVMGNAKWWQAKDTQGVWRKISPALPVALGPGGAEARSCTQGLGSSGLKTL